MAAHTIREAVAAWSRRQPDQIAIRAESQSPLSYADLDRNLEQITATLAAAGIGRGDTVALSMPACATTALLTVGVMGAACVAPLNPALPAPAVDAALARLRPRLLVVSPETPPWVREVASRHGVAVGTATPDGSGRAGAAAISVPASPDGPEPAPPALPGGCALLLQTSGATGAPKIVPLTHNTIHAGADSLIRSVALDSADIALHTLPMHHVGGIVDLLAAPLMSGGTVVVSTPFAAPAVLHALDDAPAPTWIQLAPAMLMELIAEHERSPGTRAGALRFVRSVSAPLPAALLHRAEETFGVPVIEIYGMTETAGVITSNPVDDRRVGTVGLPVDLGVRVTGPDGTEMPPDREGEICVRGESVMDGYLTNGGDDPAESPFADGWLRTGDLGVRDTAGYLRITGRVKDTINRGGEMISPAVIDRVLLEHPAVMDAAAFGAPHPSLGELVAAAVVARPGTAPDVEDLQSWVAARLPSSMVPRPILLVEAIPRTDGKLRRGELRRLLPAATGGAATASTVGTALSGMWRSVLGVTSIGPDDDFFALGGDSLRAAALVARLSEQTGDIVYVSAVFDAPTLARFEEHLSLHYPRAAAVLGGAVATPEVHEQVTDQMIDRFRDLIRQPAAPSRPPPERNPRCAFLLSAPRSGSTLLRTMLAGHRGLFAPPELYLLGYPDLAERSRHFPSPHASQLEGAVRALMQAENIGAAAAADRIRRLEAAGMTTTEFYGLLQRAVSGRLLVDKTPANALSVNTLRRAEREFTDPLYIHLVRHPSAMVASFVEANLAPLWRPRILGPDASPDLLDDITPSQLGELLWLVLNSTIEEFLAEVPPERVVRVRFEDLVTNPARTLEPVCAVLGVEFSPLLLDPYDAAPERMTDGLHEQSRMIGDPKFHRHGRIDPSRAQRRQKDGPPITLSGAAAAKAQRYGYDESPACSTPTPGQKRVSALSRLNPDSSVYNVPLAFRLIGEIDLLALDRALTRLQERHAALRASFPVGDDGPRQLIAKPGPVVVPLTNCSWVRRQNEPETADREFLRMAEQTIREPFDLETGPLWRAAVFHDDDRTHLLVMAFHHIIFDGLSRTVLLTELGELYSAATAGREADLPALAPYQTVLARQVAADAASADRDRTYWHARFDPPPPPLVLPADHDRPPGPGRARSITVELPDEGAAAVREFCRDRGVTPAALWLASTAILFQRWTGQTDQVVFVPTSGRHSVSAEAQIGYFNRIVPIRLDLSGDPAVEDMVSTTMRRILEAVDHDGTALQDLATAPGMARALTPTALVSYQEVPDHPLEMSGLAVRNFAVRREASDFDLAVHIEAAPSGVRVVIDYHAGLFENGTVAEFGRLLTETVEMVVEVPSGRLSAIAAGAHANDVEAVLTAHAKVDDCAVVMRDGRLDAYLVVNEFDIPSLAEITEHARQSLPAFRMPSAFVTVDRLPRTPDGAVDSGALPVPLQAHPPGDVLAPRDELERVIADIWRSVLWFDGEIGVHDSFRALGGHSLLAVQMVTAIETHLGHPVPAAALRHLDTIAGMAEALRDGTGVVNPASGSDSVLSEDILRGLLAHTSTWAGVRHHESAVTVGLNVEGARPALFWCLQGDHEHRALALHLGPDQPVYAMRSGYRVMVKSDENIDLLARHYVEEILAIQPSGPYLLGGNCQAARIAIRIANHLRDRGHDVPLLFMMEKFDPTPYTGAVAMLFGRDSDRNPYLSYTAPHIGYRKWYSGPLWIRQMTGVHGKFFTELNIPSLAGLVDEHLRGVIDPSVLPPGVAASETAPAPMGAGAYRASVNLLGRPVVERDSIRVDVTVTNVSTEAWPGGAAGGIGLGYRWIPDGSGTPAALTGLQALVSEVGVGEQVTTSIDVAPPAGDGVWVLEVDVVEQGVTWFGARGSRPLRVTIAVEDGSVRAT